MSDAREMVQRELRRMGECRRHDFGAAEPCTCEDPRHAARALAGALDAALDLLDACETAVAVSEGTILAGAVRVRMGAYARVSGAIASALAGDSDA